MDAVNAAMIKKKRTSLIIRTSNRHYFVVSNKIAKAFGIFKKLFDEKESDDVTDTIHQVKVSSSIFEMVLAFASHLENDQGPLDYDENPISEWDAKFIDIDLNTITELIEAAKNLR